VNELSAKPDTAHFKLLPNSMAFGSATFSKMTLAVDNKQNK